MSICSFWANSKDSPMNVASPHCLANMMATYNTLEEKLVDFVSACHRYMYVYDVIRFNVAPPPPSTRMRIFV